MRFGIIRLIRIFTLLSLLLVPVYAQDAPTISITPESGPVESAVFDIEISGLQPDTAYTITIVFDGEVVFSSDDTSDASGTIPYPVSSTPGDLPGAYTLQVVSEGEVIVSADFELTTATETVSEGRRD